MWRDVPLPALLNTSSQDAEDLYAYDHYFYRRGDGTFLELGALDGMASPHSVLSSCGLLTK